MATSPGWGRLGQVFSPCPTCGCYWGAEALTGLTWEGEHPPEMDFCATPPRQVKPDPTPLLTSRHNVFQNDEFDVFSRDSVDLSRVHKGRR